MIATGGTVVLIGLSPAGETAELELPAPLLAPGAHPRLARRRPPAAGRLPAACAWALDGTLDLAGMVTRTAPLDDWSNALDVMQDGSVIRTVLTP